MDRNRHLMIRFGGALAMSLFSISLAQATPTESAPTNQPIVNTPAALFNDNSKNEPTDISADSLSLFSKERRFVYTGNVEVVKGEMKLTAKELEGFYDEQNQIQQLVAKIDVLITKGPTIKASGNRATYERKSETLTLSENPTLEQTGSILTADRIIIHLNEDRSTAEGKVHVKLVNDSIDQVK